MFIWTLNRYVVVVDQKITWKRITLMTNESKFRIWSLLLDVTTTTFEKEEKEKED